MHNNLIKHFIVGLIIFSNLSFGKEFSELFTIYEPIKNSSNIEKSINISFNKMVYRLSGSDSPSNIWKIINSGVSRKDLIISYSIKNIDNLSYLQVNFDQSLIIKTFNNLSIPVVGYSRPVVFFLIEIDSGSEAPYFLSSAISPRRVDNILKDNMNKLSQDRGIFLELPIFDLEDTKTLSSMSVFNSPNEYISSKYNYDNLIQIKITNSGLGEWILSGDINKSFIGNNFYQDLEEVFSQFLTKLIDQNLNDLAIVTSKNSELYISLQGISSFDSYTESRQYLERFIGIKTLEIVSFKDNIITYKAKIVGDEAKLAKTIKNSSFLNIIDKNNSNNSLSLEYIK
tara:strand:- start:1011 stop:2036 length:1026 start_codon:yes stop_codon:yes gene_type:complete